MEYTVSKLAENYVKILSEKEIDIKLEKFPTFNIDAYNDYEYLSCIRAINQEFDMIDDCYVTEEFLKGD